MKLKLLFFVALLGLSLFSCRPPGVTQVEGESTYETSSAPEVESLPEEVPLPPALPYKDGPSFLAFDLLLNRPLAHRITVDKEGRTSFWVDGRTPDFVRYVQGNHHSEWFLFATEEELSFSATRGREASMVIPGVPSQRDSVLELLLLNPARGTNELTLSVNEQALEPARLDVGWQVLQFPIPEEALGAENHIELSFSNLGRVEGRLSGGGVAWARIGPLRSAESGLQVQLGGEPVEVADQEVDEVETAQIDAAPEDSDYEVADEERVEEELPFEEVHQLVLAQQELELHSGQGLSWTSWVHDDAWLRVGLSGEEGCGLRVQILRELGGGEIEEVLFEDRFLVEGRGREQTTDIDLGLKDAQVARISLWHVGDCSSILIEEAQLRRPGEETEVPEEIEPPKYVLFWIIDTLRADYLPLHFETDVQAPNLKQLADEGVSFARAYVQGTESRASHATLFTAQYPERHGVMARGRVDRSVPILPTLIQDQGYQTALFASNGYVSHLLNLNRGWDHYQNNIHLETSLDARSMAREGLAWMTPRLEDPFFVYIGTIDPHVTYRKHREVIELYEPEPYNGRFRRFLSGDDLGRIKGGYLSVTDREKERIINLYKNEITFNDLAFGELRAELEELGIWEDTLVVITSDHGEEFWEHGSVGHGHNVHQEMVHVPLIFYYPKGLPQGAVVQSGGEVVDVLPTVLELLGIEIPSGQQGRSLLPKIFGQDGGYPAPAIATQYGLHYGVQIMDWKLYLRSGRMRFYNRTADPLELHDIGFDHPLANRLLLDTIGYFRAYRSQWEKSSWGVPNNLSEEFLSQILPSDDEE